VALSFARRNWARTRGESVQEVRGGRFKRRLIAKRGVDFVPHLVRVADSQCRGFQILVTQIMLDRPDGYAGFLPSRSTRLSEAVKVNVFADRIRCAGHFNLFLRGVLPLRDLCSALAAVDART